MHRLIVLLVEMMRAWVPSNDGVDRYEQIAKDALIVAYDPNEPPLYQGQDGRFQTAVQLLATASFESHFSRDVEEGKTRGDHGKAYCLMQVHPEKGLMLDTPYFRYNKKGLQGRDLVRNRRTCFRAGLHFMRASFELCKRFGDKAKLSAYTTGKCKAHEPLSALYLERALAHERDKKSSVAVAL